MPDADKQTQKALGKVQGEVFKSKYLDRVKPFPGAHDLLARVHAAGQIAVFASSASEEEVCHYLGLLNAHELVAVTTSAHDVEKTKPAPDIFAMALKKAGQVSADEAIVIGDTPYDIQAAARCGIPAIAVRSGKFLDTLLRATGPIAIYDDVAALFAGYEESPLVRSDRRRR